MNVMQKLTRYVVITPARNEADFIELTIKSLIAQTVLPLRWVIVNDGSTDGTEEIVRRYAAGHPWIDLIQMPERRDRNFAGKAHAFNRGYALVKDLDYEAVSNVDADVSVDEDYFRYLLDKLAEDPGLGLVGTPFQDAGSGSTYNYRFVSKEHVSGIIQVFRRQCFEDIGGYQPMKGGGIDYVAVVTSRMKGWKTRTFTDKVSMHHRAIGRAADGPLLAKYKVGVKDYTFGNHPLWELFRMFYQMRFSPVILGGLAIFSGYAGAAIKGVERPVSPQFIAFCRKEQMLRLKGAFSIRSGAGKAPWRHNGAP